MTAEPRNNRRPYKADIRRVAEEQLALAADRIIAAKVALNDAHARLHEAHGDIEAFSNALEDCEARDKRNRALLAECVTHIYRYRIACLALAVVAVVGWLT